MAAVLVYMPWEMLNDAKWYLSEAQRLDKQGEKAAFLRRRGVRVTAIFAIDAVESFMNHVAYKYVEEHPHLEEHVRDYLQERQTYVKDGQVRDGPRYVGLKEKLGGWTKIITGNTFDKSDQAWTDFLKVKRYRDDLVHYRQRTRPTVYARETVDMAQRAVCSAESMIERFHQCWGKPTPSWVHADYREFD